MRYLLTNIEKYQINKNNKIKLNIKNINTKKGLKYKMRT